MPYKTTNFQYFEKALADLGPLDPAKPWSEYPCLIWTRTVITTGYGVMDHNGKRLGVNREAYQRFDGVIPNKSPVRHFCGSPLCFHPKHLFVPNDSTCLQYLTSKLKTATEAVDSDWKLFPCLIWDLGVINGYGTLRVNGASHRAHRFAYSVAIGIELESTDFICHHCDTPRCFRPSHMFLGNPSENSKDMADKYRSAWGERNGHHKLTEEDVHQIRSIYASGTMGPHRLGMQFGVSKTAIIYILSGRNWAKLAHLKPNLLTVNG